MDEVPEWRVTFWFLVDGWIQIGFAFVKAKSEHLALMLCAQRASKLGFRVDGDTKVEIRAETGDGRLLAMTDSRSTLDDEVDDEPLEDTRETCFFWESRTGRCHFEPLILGSEPCADCPED